MIELSEIEYQENGEHCISDVDLQLHAGQFNVLLGPTLAGKTTLMRIMAGLTRPLSGVVRFNGKDVTTCPVRERNVAMVYQQFVNYPTMNVFDNIASPLAAAGIPKSEIRQRVQECAKLLHLEDFLARRPSELSGGQQQRTALARALVKDADLVLLDEPLANLDYKLREELREELPRLLAGRRAVVVYATSDPAEALLLGGNVAVLHEGKMLQFGETASVFRQPDNLKVAGIFSDPPLNAVAAVKQSQHFIISGDTKFHSEEFAALNDGNYTLAFRAHHLMLEKPDVPAIELPGKVQISEIAGSETFVHVHAAGNDWVAQTSLQSGWEPETRINLFIDPRKMMVFSADGRRITEKTHGIH